MKVYKFLPLVLLIPIWFLFAKQSVVPSMLVAYVKNPDNNLVKVKDIGNIRFELLYKPVDFIIANEMRTDELKKSAHQKRAGELDGLQYYNLKISMPRSPGMDVTNYNVKNEQAIQNRLYYLSFHMKNDIRMIQGKDTLSPVLFHFERSYNVTPHRTFVMAFDEPDKKKEDDKTFVIDTPIFNTGPVKMKFKKEDLQKIPNLKLL